MTERTLHAPGNGGQASETPISLDAAFTETVQGCPGCLTNCYMMEESIGFTGNGLKEKLLNTLLLILEIPTIIQMAIVTANRHKS